MTDKLSTVVLRPPVAGAGVAAPWYPTSFTPGVDPLSDGAVLRLPIFKMFNGAVSGIDLLPSPAFYDATNDASYVEWARCAAGLNTRTSFIINGGSDFAWFDLDDTSLSARYYDSGNVTVATIPFDPIMHRLWRIRHGGGHMHWEVASVLGAWGEIATEVTQSWGSWNHITDVTISAAHINVTGAVTAESQLVSFNGSTAAAGGCHDPISDEILAAVRKTY